LPAERTSFFFPPNEEWPPPWTTRMRPQARFTQEKSRSLSFFFVTLAPQLSLFFVFPNFPACKTGIHPFPFPWHTTPTSEKSLQIGYAQGDLSLFARLSFLGFPLFSQSTNLYQNQTSLAYNLIWWRIGDWLTPKSSSFRPLLVFASLFRFFTPHES